METIEGNKFYLRNGEEADKFGEFCARDRMLEMLLERHFRDSKILVDNEYDPEKRGVHINHYLNLGRALLRCNEIAHIKK